MPSRDFLWIILMRRMTGFPVVWVKQWFPWRIEIWPLRSESCRDWVVLLEIRIRLVDTGDMRLSGNFITWHSYRISCFVWVEPTGDQIFNYFCEINCYLLSQSRSIHARERLFIQRLFVCSQFPAWGATRRRTRASRGRSSRSRSDWGKEIIWRIFLVRRGFHMNFILLKY